MKSAENVDFIGSTLSGKNSIPCRLHSTEEVKFKLVVYKITINKKAQKLFTSSWAFLRAFLEDYEKRV